MTVAELRALLEGAPAEWAGAPVLAVGYREHEIESAHLAAVMAAPGCVEHYLVLRLAREAKAAAEAGAPLPGAERTWGRPREPGAA